MFGTSMLSLMVALFASSCGATLWGSVKQNCGVSLWSEWSPVQDNVTRTRNRTVYRQPQNGGALCPDLMERETNPWNPQRTAVEIAPVVETSFLSSKSITVVSNGRRRRQTQAILPRDILFIVDMSGSIGRAEFEVAKRNIADLVGKICGDVGQGRLQNRVAVISFSTNAVINFRFADHMTLQQVQDAIMAIPYEGGGTCLDKALREAVGVFTNDTGLRADAASVKEVLMLTDGAWNCDVVDATIYNLVAALSASSNGRPIAIYALVIGMSTDPDYQTKFDNLVTTPVQNHLFVFTGMSTFREAVQIILTYGGCHTVCAPITI